MERIKVCEYCKKEFIAKSSLARYCSHNCRMNGYYHQKNPNAINYIMGKTDEEKKEYRNQWARNYYAKNEEYKNYMIEKRKQYWREHHI